MCILLGIGLGVLMVAFSPLVALIFGAGAAVNAAQKKRAEGEPPIEQEFNRPLALRIAFILILLLVAFIVGLMIRYWTT